MQLQLRQLSIRLRLRLLPRRLSLRLRLRTSRLRLSGSRFAKAFDNGRRRLSEKAAAAARDA